MGTKDGLRFCDACGRTMEANEKLRQAGTSWVCSECNPQEGDKSGEALIADIFASDKIAARDICQFCGVKTPEDQLSTVNGRLACRSCASELSHPAPSVMMAVAPGHSVGEVEEANKPKPGALFWCLEILAILCMISAGLALFVWGCGAAVAFFAGGLVWTAIAHAVKWMDEHKN